MPQKATATQQSGELEAARIMLLSEAAEAFTNDELQDAIIIVIPDTGKARFNPSHESKPDKDGKTKQTKSVFVVAELGGSFAGIPIEYRQSQGDVEGLPLSIKMSLIAQAPNAKGTTVDEALNRKVETLELVENAA